MKKKILFVIWSFTAGGGAEKILANICNNMDESKYEISILEMENFDVRKEFVKDNIKVLKPISRINNKAYFSKKSKFMQIVSRIRIKILKLMLYNTPKILRKIILKEKYDIEIAFNYYMPSIFVAASSDKIKKVTWVHSSIEDLNYIENEDKSIKRKYLRQKEAFKNMNKIVAISNRTRKSILDIYPEYENKIISINNGFDFNLIRKLSLEEVKYKKSKSLIVAVGRLVEQKNFNLLIDVAKILNERMVECEILILGDGEQREMLDKKIKELNLKKMVKLMGYIKNPYPYMREADVFCLTSLAEGFPTVIAESLALDCPFVSTRVAGVDELSGYGKCGIVVENKKESIANALINIIENEELKKSMAKNCKNIINQYTIKNQIENIEKMIQEL